MILTGIIVFLVAFAIVTALGWSGYMLFRPQEDPLADRLDQLQANAIVNATRAPRRKGGGGFSNSLLYLVSAFPGGEDWIRDTETHMSQAGVRSKAAVAFYSLFVILFLALMVGGLVYFNRDKALYQMLTPVIAGCILGWLLPRRILYYLARRYKQKLQDALPDTVDLLGIVLGTGMALDQAMTRVSEEMQFIYPELANEFYTVVMQVRAGQDRSKAFQQLVRRTGIEDIKSLAAMIIQSERFGTSLSQALKVYADALRTRRRLRAEAAVAKAGIKMLFPIVLFILPALFVVALVPGVLSALRAMAGGIGAR